MDLCEETYNIWSNVSNKTQCMHHCIWCCCHWCQMGLTDFSTSIHMIILRLLCWSFSSCSHVCRNCRFLQMGFQCFCHRQARVVSDCKLSIFGCMTSCIIVIWVDDPPSSRPQLCCSCCCCPVGWFDELKPSPRSSSSGGLSPCPTTREF